MNIVVCMRQHLDIVCLNAMTEQIFGLIITPFICTYLPVCHGRIRVVTLLFFAGVVGSLSVCKGHNMKEHDQWTDVNAYKVRHCM